MTKNFEERLQRFPKDFSLVVPFEKEDRLLLLDFTETNPELSGELLADTPSFSHYIQKKLRVAGARYGIGGYNEHRTIYSRSGLFDATGEEPRRLHLGTDIWGEAHTKVMAPIEGVVHSFAFNNNFGDYGATIILRHDLDGFSFHTLYGHLSLHSIKNLEEGAVIKKGQSFAEFGKSEENGQWPPHLHFQLIIDMDGRKGDYPGVCRFSERETYLQNCPDPDLILRMMPYAFPDSTRAAD